MQHPFGGILGSSDEQDSGDQQSRREYLQTALQVGVGVVAAGVVGTTSAEDEPAEKPKITTAAGPDHPEHGGKLPMRMTKAGPGHPEHGGRFGLGVTRAGPSHPEHAGAKVRNAMRDVSLAQMFLKRNDWVRAAARLAQVRKLAAPEEDKHGHFAKLQKSREQVEANLTKTVTKALDTADKQAKEGNLVPALQAYRKAEQLDDHYGLTQRAQSALAQMAKQEGYAAALEKVKQLESRPPISVGPTTLAIGEEGGRPVPSTRALGEEGGRGGATTERLGEEGGAKPDVPRATTLAIGEEG